jgi:hypothetical protein
MAASRPALIEKDRVKPPRVEQIAMRMLGAAARTTVEKQGRYTVPVTALFHIEPMAISDAQHHRIEWTLWVTRLAHGRCLFLVCRVSVSVLH